MLRFFGSDNHISGHIPRRKPTEDLLNYIVSGHVGLDEVKSMPL
jgi:hypothetical protein